MYQSYNTSGYQMQIPRTTQIQPIQTAPMLKGRPVSSLEEVRAAGIDFDGSIFYFPDLANKRIYTKQINLDGTSSLIMYEQKEIPVEASPYVTKQEFEEALAQFKASLTMASAQPISVNAPVISTQAQPQPIIDQQNPQTQIVSQPNIAQQF